MCRAVQVLLQHLAFSHFAKWRHKTKRAHVHTVCVFPHKLVRTFWRKLLFVSLLLNHQRMSGFCHKIGKMSRKVLIPRMQASQESYVVAPDVGDCSIGSRRVLTWSLSNIFEILILHHASWQLRPMSRSAHPSFGGHAEPLQWAAKSSVGNNIGIKALFAFCFMKGTVIYECETIFSFRCTRMIESQVLRTRV